MRRLLSAVTAGLVAVAVPTTSAVLGAPAAPVWSTVAGTSSEERAGCRLVRLRTPGESPWGTVMDIERVRGRTVHYGSYDRVRPDGELRTRSAVWRGLRARPEVVGPRGWPVTIAFDLTRTGLVNGLAEDPDSGAQRFWVQDLRTGQLRWLRTGLGGAPVDFAWIRGLNDRGAAAGWVAQDGGERLTAVGHRPRSSRPFALPTPRRALWSQASGINDRSDRAGAWVEDTVVDGVPAQLFVPTVWDRTGRRTTLAVPGLDGVPRTVSNRRQVVGDGWWGSLETGHVEAVFWPSYDRAVALGLLPGGGFSSLFGLDRQGRVVGGGDRLEPESPLADPDMGTVQHSFVWEPALGAGRVRVLPTLHSVRTGETDWRRFYATHLAHASHSGLDRIGAGTHAGFDADGAPVGAPTVFLNASRCGTTVRTTHEAFWEGPAAGPSAAGRSASGQSASGAGREAPTLTQRRAPMAAPDLR